MQPRLLREPVRLAGPALLGLQSDERLVRLTRDGHQPAFAVIVQRYHAALLRYCVRLVGDQRAEDAVQQTFANAHRALTERETEVELRPWLYRVAHNAALNTLRGQTPGDSLDDPEGPAAWVSGAGPADDVEGTVVRRERLQDTLAAISALPVAQRDALLLRELEGRSHVEIAAALGVTTGAARQHLMRARAAVRAAASAVTPYPLLVKLSAWMTFTPTGERVTQVAVGAGLGAGAAKVAAGVLATGALVGGVVGTGTVAALHRDATAKADAATAQRRPAPAVSRSAGVPVAARAGNPVPAAPGAGRTTRPASGPVGRRTAASSEDRGRHGEPSSGRLGTSGSDDDRSGSAGSGDDRPDASTARTEDDRATSGSSSGEGSESSHRERPDSSSSGSDASTTSGSRSGSSSGSDSSGSSGSGRAATDDGSEASGSPSGSGSSDSGGSDDITPTLPGVSVAAGGREGD